MAGFDIFNKYGYKKDYENQSILVYEKVISGIEYVIIFDKKNKSLEAFKCKDWSDREPLPLDFDLICELAELIKENQVNLTL